MGLMLGFIRPKRRGMIKANGLQEANQLGLYEMAKPKQQGERKLTRWKLKAVSDRHLPPSTRTPDAINHRKKKALTHARLISYTARPTRIRIDKNQLNLQALRWVTLTANRGYDPLYLISVKHIIVLACTSKKFGVVA